MTDNVNRFLSAAPRGMNRACCIPVLLCVCASAVAAIAKEAARLGAGAEVSQRAAQPLTVSRTDELYKPALLSDGTLVATALPTVDGVQRIVAIYSKDDGHTWSEPATLFSLPRDEGSFGYYDFLVDRDGEMHFFFLLDPATATKARRSGSLPPVAEAKLDISYVRSTDRATAWQAPRRIWEGRAGDLLSVVQLKSGRLLLPICYRTNRGWSNRGEDFNAYTYTGQFDSSALYSDDNGNNWKHSPSVLRTPTPDILTIEGAVEPVVIQLKDGRIWMLIRTQMGRFYESYSTDDGQSWSPPNPTSLISSDSPAGLVRLLDGRIVMILNCCSRFPYAYGGRHVLHAAISDDDGRTWRGYREIVRDPLRGQPPPPGGDFGSSYPYPCATKDGQVVFSMGVETGTRSMQPANPPGFQPTQKRSLILFDPDWLTETSQRTDFSHGLDDWSAFGVKGVALAPHPTRKGANALSIRKSESAWPAGAVWNFPMGAQGHLRIKLLLKPGFGGAVLGLTDHYSVPYDSEDTFHNVFNVAIGADGKLADGGKLEPDVWRQVDVNWNTATGNSQIELDGQEVAELRGKRESEGISYLRLRSTAAQTDLAGFLVDSVEVNVQP